MNSRARLAIIATVVLLLSGALPASSSAEDGDGDPVAVLFDFGDGILNWQEVPLPDPANAWCATMAAAEQGDLDLEYSFSQWGVLLEGVNGYDTPLDFSMYWGLWTWNGNTGDWESSMVGALDLAVENGTAFAWRFGAFGDPPPSATPDNRWPWLGFRGGGPYNGYAENLPPAGGVFWSADMGNGPIDSTLAVADGKVFGITAGIFNWSSFEFTQYPTVFALDATTGGVVWEEEFIGSGGFEIGSPAYSNGVVYVTVSSRKVMAMDADTGDLLWETPVDDLGLSASPTVAGSRVLVGTGSGKLIALSTSDGSINWSSNVSGWVYLAAPTVYKERVYIGTDNGTLHAFHLGNGTEIWTIELPGRIRGTPLVVDDRVFAISAIYPGFVATEGFLHAIETDGNYLWNVSIGPTGSSPALIGPNVVVGSKSGLWAIDQDDGTVAWRYQAVGQVSASPVGNMDQVIFQSNENDTDNELHTSVVLLDLNGEEIWTREMVPHNWALSSVSVADGIAFTATDAGWVYALGDTPFHADFDFEVDGLEVRVTATSTSVGVDNVLHAWTFEGSDDLFDGENVTFAFDRPGTYWVEYIFVDEFDRVMMVTKNVTVVKPPAETETFDMNLLLIPLVVVIVLILVAVFMARRG